MGSSGAQQEGKRNPHFPPKGPRLAATGRSGVWKSERREERELVEERQTQISYRVADVYSYSPECWETTDPPVGAVVNRSDCAPWDWSVVVEGITFPKKVSIRQTTPEGQSKVRPNLISELYSSGLLSSLGRRASSSSSCSSSSTSSLSSLLLLLLFLRFFRFLLLLPLLFLFLLLLLLLLTHIPNGINDHQTSFPA
eukprot:GHVU01182022.1.p1 GENE.GHVU01182022.1~~GHVU01182022.1.p1  ORF type:complete len:197 (-),score=34.39 GHVU01182022.1:22-612(-)